MNNLATSIRERRHTDGVLDLFQGSVFSRATANLVLDLDKYTIRNAKKFLYKLNVHDGEGSVSTELLVKHAIKISQEALESITSIIEGWADSQMESEVPKEYL